MSPCFFVAIFGCFFEKINVNYSMIDINNFKALLRFLKFEEKENIFHKKFENEAYLKVDFSKKELIYPEDKGLIINERQTCNFSQNENFVVFECVHRLLEKGYKAEHIELEPKWKVGRGASGGRADILIKNQTKKPLLLIECKTEGKEFEKAWKNTLEDGDQLFSYAQQISEVEFLCLYASDFDKKNQQLNIHQRIISHKDNEDILNQQQDNGQALKSFQDASNVGQRYKVWKNTYQKEYTESGIFEDNIQAYQIGKDKYTLKYDTNPLTAADKEGKYHRFRTILRTHNIARKETAFEVLVNLFLCKIVDEQENPTDLRFYWKGIAYDNYFDFVDRLQELYKVGMRKFLDEDITYISNKQIDDAFWTVANDRNATKKTIQKYFRKLKFFSNTAFSFINVHNERLFNKNTKVLIEIARMWQSLRLKTDEQNQFLGDMFEYFLDNSIKQSEGQFFTPMPICKFIVSSLPLEYKIKHTQDPLLTIDYACGSGHFLNEYAHQIKPLVEKHKKVNVSDYYKATYGVEKEDRLAKVAKVSAFMYGQDDIQILERDALDNIANLKLESFDVLVANPPFAVEGFLTTLPEIIRHNYALTEITGINSNTKNIQCFFIERAKQLLAPSGVVGIIVPASVLSNTDATHIGTRAIILKYFDIISLVELGSGTFGKTGTNTVVLFLRRKAQRPEPAEHFYNRSLAFFEGIPPKDDTVEVYKDLYLVKKYCEHIDIEFEDYKKLLNITRNDLDAAVILQELCDKYDIFQDYQSDFNKSTIIKNIKHKHFKKISDLPKQIEQELKKQYKEAKKRVSQVELKEAVKQLLPEKEQELLAKQKLELYQKWVDYLRQIEQDKLYYFMLAYKNPQKVLIVKSPSKNKEQKKFLGYEWSGSKGKEGIKYYGGETVNDIITPLFDPKNINNSQKISYYIQQNFLGKTFSNVPEHCSYASVTDILDFSRTDFNKVFSLSPKKNIKIDTKWDLVKLGEVVKILIGGTPSRRIQTYFEGKNLWVSIAEMNGQIIIDTKEKITEEGVKNSNVKLIPKGTTLLSFKLSIGKTAIAGADLYTNEAIAGLIPIDSKKILDKYLYQLFNAKKIDLENVGYKTFGKSLNSKLLKEEIKIPLPPLHIQQKIVADCEEVDKAVEVAKKAIKKWRLEIEEKVKAESQKYPPQKLTKFVEIISGGTPKTNVAAYWNGDIPWLSVADYSKVNRFVEKTEKHITKLGLENSNTRYLNKGDLIISARGTVGALAQLAIPMTFNQSSYGLRGNDKLDNGYLFYILKQEIKQLQDKAIGVTFGAIIKSTFDNIKIPVPPLNIQETLVNEILGIERQIRGANNVIENASQMKQEILEKYL